MKKIEAVVRHSRLDEVKVALQQAGFKGMLLTEILGSGAEGHTELIHGIEYEVDLVPKIKIEAIVQDEDAEKFVQTLMHTARTGAIGDGKIFITTIDNVIRIRTGEMGKAAL